MFQSVTSFVAAAVPNAEKPPGRDEVYNYPVLIVRDDDRSDEILRAICNFLEIDVEFVTTDADIASVLCDLYPIAVITGLEGDAQDGFHVMKVVARHARGLPILLLTRNDAPLEGAVEAVQEIWRLSHVSTVEDVFHISDVVEFLCQAARDAGRTGTMRT